MSGKVRRDSSRGKYRDAKLDLRELILLSNGVKVTAKDLMNIYLREYFSMWLRFVPNKELIQEKLELLKELQE